MEWSSIKRNIVFKKWDPLLGELKHQQWGGEATSNDASQGSRATGESWDLCTAMTGWTVSTPDIIPVFLPSFMAVIE